METSSTRFSVAEGSATQDSTYGESPLFYQPVFKVDKDNIQEFIDSLLASLANDFEINATFSLRKKLPFASLVKENLLSNNTKKALCRMQEYTPFQDINEASPLLYSGYEVE